MALLAVPPPVTISMPPEFTVVLFVAPPEFSSSMPPLSVVLLAVPYTASVPPR